MEIIDGSNYIMAVLMAIYIYALGNFQAEVAVIVGIITGLWVLFQLIRGIVKFIWEIKDRKKK